MDDDIAIMVVRCRIAVDDGQLVAIEIIDETGCRIDNQGSAAYDQQIGLGDGSDGFGDDFIIQRFLIQDHIRFDDRMTLVTVRNTFGFDDIIQIKEFAASGTVVS